MKRNKREKLDSIWVVYIIVIFFLFKTVEYVIKSWEWVNCVVFLIFWFVASFAMKYIRLKRKEKSAILPKKFRSKYPIIPQYIPPKDLNPAEAGLLYNCRVDVTDLTSLIYQWAFDWLILIWNVKSKEDWKTLSKIELTKLRDIEDSRPFFEKEIFNSIFLSCDKKVITNSFELRYALMLEDLEYHWIKKWWIVRSWSGKIMWIIYNILVALLLFVWYMYFSWWFALYSWMLFLLLILFMACILFWWYVDWGKLWLTNKWAELAAYMIWYRNFIKSCDEDIIKLCLKEDPLFIDKTLPYATAFWLETEFLNKVTPLAWDRKAQYINWQKVSTTMKVITALLRSSSKNRFDVFYHW